MNLYITTGILFQILLLSNLLFMSLPGINLKRSPAESFQKEEYQASSHLVNQTEMNKPATFSLGSIYTKAVYLPVIYKQPGKYYYISPNGTDPANCTGGTQSNPWKTWSKAEKCISANSTVYFMAGNYSNIFSQAGATRITFAGQPDKPIQLKAAPGAEGKVFFNQIFNIYGSYGVISGININANSSETAISIYGAQHILLEGNTIHNSSVQDCIHIHQGSDYILLVNNEVYDCGYRNTSYTGPGDAVDTTGGTNLLYQDNRIHDAMRGFQIKGGAANVLVENNRIYDTDSAIFGSSMTALSGNNPRHGNPAMHDPAVPVESRYQAKNIIVRNNLIYNITSDDVITPRGWVNYAIVNNTLFNLSGAYIFWLSSAKWYFFDSTAIAYCASHSCSPCTSYSGSLTCVNVPLLAKDGKIQNNIIYNFGSRPFLADPGNTANLQMSHNLYFKPGFTKNTTAYGINGRWYSLTGFQALGYEANTQIGDPQFINLSDPSNPNLKLNKTSLAVDRGVPVPEVSQDIEGINRPQGVTFDIGAYEFISVQLTTPTPTQTPTTAPPTITPNPTNTPTPSRTPTVPSTVTPTSTNEPTTAPPTATPTSTDMPTAAPPTATPIPIATETPLPIDTPISLSSTTTNG